MSLEIREKAGIRHKEGQAILDKAKTEKRELTAAESAEASRAFDEAETMIEALPELTGTVTRQNLDLGGETKNWTRGDGREVRMLNRSESLAGYVRETSGGGSSEKLSASRALIAYLKGDWSKAEAERRAIMATSNDIAGGFLLGSPMSAEVIDLARNRSVIFRAGAVTIPMGSSELGIARVTGDATGYWRRENTAITESSPTLGKFMLTAHTLGALVRTSVELIEDAPNAGDLISASLANALALELDRVGLFGSGAAAEPQGVANAGITSEAMGDNGAALTDFGNISLAIQRVHEANGAPNAIVMAPRTFGEIDRLVNGQGDPLVPPPSYVDLPKLVSNQIPTNQVQGSATDATSVLVGDWTKLGVGMRTQVTIEASRTGDDGAFAKMQILIRAYLRADVVTLQPGHFAKLIGVIPPSE